jgi:sugar phosphate isomerase/epimerase
LQPIPGGTALAPVRLGVDVYSLRSQSWTPIQYLDYCAALGARVVHFSEARFVGALEKNNLERIRARALELRLDIELGMRSICPTSQLFDAALGSAEDQLIRMIDAARLVGSPLVRCFMGNSTDRLGPVALRTHIRNTVGVLKNVRSRAVETGVKIAVENHSGDLQAWELAGLIESAGPEFVGACLDSGNPVWALEDPLLALELLAPYVLTSHFRDTRVWKTPKGAAAAWRRMGQGNIGMEEYLRAYVQKCPGRPVSLEIIVKGPRYFPYLEPDFWDAYRDTPAWQFARFLALVEKGTPPADSSDDARPAPAVEMEDLCASLSWTRDFLAGLAQASNAGGTS